MKNFRMTIQYEGTRYHGWQVQGNTDGTIQGKLQQVLTQLNGSEVEVHGSGRTDAGVHARGQVANVKMKDSITCQQILEQCAKYLPRDIAVIDVTEAPERFHARLNAKSKTYCYRLWTSEISNVFERRELTEYTEHPLDLTLMRQAAADLCGTHDFRSFCGLRRFKKSTVRTITDIKVEQFGPEIRLTYTGNGFLNLMVRILTGTLVEVGAGLRAPDSMPKVLEALDRSAAGPAMPPKGLCLMEVNY